MTSRLSPQSVRPFHGALPVETSRLAVPGCTTAPPRAQIAESLAPQVLGVMIEWRFEHSVLKTPSMCPLARPISTTWPWYGGASPM